MKIYVVYENSNERQAAANLAQVVNASGHLFANAVAQPDSDGVGVKLVINAGPKWPIDATVHDLKDVRIKSKLAPPTSRGRDLIFEDEE